MQMFTLLTRRASLSGSHLAGGRRRSEGCRLPRRPPPLLHACQPSWRNAVRQARPPAGCDNEQTVPHLVESSVAPTEDNYVLIGSHRCPLLITSAELTSRPRRGGSSCIRTSSGSAVADCGLAVAAILLCIERYLLAFDKVRHSRALKRARMHKHVFSAIVGLDKTKALLHVKKFHCSRNHRGSSFRCSAFLLGAKRSRGSRIVHRCWGV